MVKRALSLSVIACFFLTTVGPLPKAHADSILGLPAPGAMISLTPAYVPVIVKGLRIHPENPILFDFIIDTGNSGLSSNSSQLKIESEKLIKYFLASLTIPDDDLWVNLSPYEKNRMIPDQLGQTEMGRDMLEEDYILKQLTASLIYPEKSLGKKFWDTVYAKAQEQYGTSQIPVNTFNKVWIVADKAKVYVHDNTAFVVASHLKVMLEEDYLSLQKHRSLPHSVASNIIRQIILPQLEEEVNYGQNFSCLRQIFHSMILAAWYKKNLKAALLNQVYSNKSKINGVDLADKTVKEKIYQQYLAAYKKGVFNYIKEDVQNGQDIPRKYFSGGLDVNAAQATTLVGDQDPAVMAFEDHPSAGQLKLVRAETPQSAASQDGAMTRGDVKKAFEALVGSELDKTKDGTWNNAYSDDAVRRVLLSFGINEISEPDLKALQKVLYDATTVTSLPGMSDDNISGYQDSVDLNMNLVVQHSFIVRELVTNNEWLATVFSLAMVANRHNAAMTALPDKFLTFIEGEIPLRLKDRFKITQDSLGRITVRTKVNEGPEDDVLVFKTTFSPGHTIGFYSPGVNRGYSNYQYRVEALKGLDGWEEATDHLRIALSRWTQALSKSNVVLVGGRSLEKAAPDKQYILGKLYRAVSEQIPPELEDRIEVKQDKQGTVSISINHNVQLIASRDGNQIRLHRFYPEQIETFSDQDLRQGAAWDRVIRGLLDNIIDPAIEKLKEYRAEVAKTAEAWNAPYDDSFTVPAPESAAMTVKTVPEDFQASDIEIDFTKSKEVGDLKEASGKVAVINEVPIDTEIQKNAQAIRQLAAAADLKGDKFHEINFVYTTVGEEITAMVIAILDESGQVIKMIGLESGSDDLLREYATILVERTYTPKIKSDQLVVLKGLEPQTNEQRGVLSIEPSGEAIDSAAMRTETSPTQHVGLKGYEVREQLENYLDSHGFHAGVFFAYDSRKEDVTNYQGVSLEIVLPDVNSRMRLEGELGSIQNIFEPGYEVTKRYVYRNSLAIRIWNNGGASRRKPERIERAFSKRPVARTASSLAKSDQDEAMVIHPHEGESAAIPLSYGKYFDYNGGFFEIIKRKGGSFEIQDWNGWDGSSTIPSGWKTLKENVPFPYTYGEWSAELILRTVGKKPWLEMRFKKVSTGSIEIYEPPRHYAYKPAQATDAAMTVQAAIGRFIDDFNALRLREMARRGRTLPSKPQLITVVFGNLKITTPISDLGNVDPIFKAMRQEGPGTEVTYRILGSRYTFSKVGGSKKGLVRSLVQAAIKAVTRSKDPAALAIPPVGGIDLNSRNMQMDVDGGPINLRFNAAMAAQFRRGDFSGVRPVILGITDILDIRPLMGAVK